MNWPTDPSHLLLTTNVRGLLREHGRNQKWLAEQLDCNQVWLSRLLTGKRPATVNELTQIAACLQVPVGQLFAEAWQVEAWGHRDDLRRSAVKLIDAVEEALEGGAVSSATSPAYNTAPVGHPHAPSKT